MIELEAGEATAVVAPAQGGRVAQLTIGGVDRLVDRDAAGEHDDPLLWGSYPMVPWVGRIRDARFEFDGVEHRLTPNLGPHAIHGTGFVARWQVLDQGIAHAELEVGLDWSFGGRAHQHLLLTDEALICVLTVVAGDRPMPAALGWHPWFVKPLHDELVFGSMYERGPDHLPTGRRVEPTARPWDDCFLAPRGPARLRYPDGVLLTVSSDADHWVVYDEPAHATCVEPQTAPPDAFNLVTSHALDPATVRLEPGGMLQRTMTISGRR